MPSMFERTFLAKDTSEMNYNNYFMCDTDLIHEKRRLTDAMLELTIAASGYFVMECSSYANDPEIIEILDNWLKAELERQ